VTNLRNSSANCSRPDGVLLPPSGAGAPPIPPRGDGLTSEQAALLDKYVLAASLRAKARCATGVEAQTPHPLRVQLSEYAKLAVPSDFGDNPEKQAENGTIPRKSASAVEGEKKSLLFNKLVSAPGTSEAIGSQYLSPPKRPKNVPLDETAQKLADSKQSLRRRAPQKFVTNAVLTLGLLRLENSPLRMYYQRSLLCSSEIAQVDGRLTSTYCNGRHCTVCGNIRTGKQLNKYLPVITSWLCHRHPVTGKAAGAYMVTLTVRNCDAPDLPGVLDEMHQAFTAYLRTVREEGVDYGGVKLRWGVEKPLKRSPRKPRVWRPHAQIIRKLECTYNAASDQYHPHFHVLVNDLDAAEVLLHAWFTKFGDRAIWKAQDVRAVDVGSARELFKYFTKIITPHCADKTKLETRRRALRLNRWRQENAIEEMLPVPDLNPGEDYHIFAEALDVMFCAMRGRIIFRACGIPGASDDDDNVTADDSTLVTDDFRVIQWAYRGHDWTTDADREALTGWVPNARLLTLHKAIKLPATASPVLRLVQDYRAPARTASVVVLEAQPDQPLSFWEPAPAAEPAEKLSLPSTLIEATFVPVIVTSTSRARRVVLDVPGCHYRAVPQLVPRQPTHALPRIERTTWWTDQDTGELVAVVGAYCAPPPPDLRRVRGNDLAFLSRTINPHFFPPSLFSV
jgi:hypothetical protein